MCIVVSFLVCIVVSCLVCIVIVILFLELQGMLLMKNCISRRLDVISLGLLYIGVNCASFAWTSGHICLEKWSYLGHRTCGNVVIFHCGVGGRNYDESACLLCQCVPQRYPMCDSLKV